MSRGKAWSAPWMWTAEAQRGLDRAASRWGCRGLEEAVEWGRSKSSARGRVLRRKGPGWVPGPLLWASGVSRSLSPVDEEGPLRDSGDLWILGRADFPAQRRVESKRFLDYDTSSCSVCTPLSIHVETYLHIHVLPSQTTSGAPRDN